MAPGNSSAKNRKPGTGRPATRPVVPVIPLPYVKRQAAAAAAAAAASSEKSPAPEVVTKPDTKASHDAEQKVGKSEDVPSSQPGHEEAGSQPPNDTTLVVQASDGSADAMGLASSVTDAPSQDDGQPTVSSPGTSEPVAATPTPASSAPVTRDLTSLDSVAHDLNPTEPSTEPAPPTEPQGAVHTFEPGQKSGNYPIKSRQPPLVSPVQYQMPPPPFQPVGRPMGMMGNGNMHRGPRHHMPNGPAHFHSAHPSNGSVHFGAFHPSPSASPAPLGPGGIAPPPGMPMPDGRQPYMAHGGNGYPPMMHYGGEMMPISSFDNYGRPTMGYQGMESYAGPGNNFAPSTPQSYADSQSPGHQEDKGMYNHFSGGPVRNIVTGPGHRDDDHSAPSQNSQSRVYNGIQELPQMQQGPNMPAEMARGDDGDGVLRYLQHQFGETEFADSTLELRYLDDRAPPVRIAGHRIIFSRSHALAELLRRQAFQPASVDRSLQIILLETDSKWVRSDSFYMAAQRLYGIPLLPIPPRDTTGSGLTQAGSDMERFSFAISYAAAGHLLQWLPLVRRGCEVATRLLNWQTLETALDFALEEYADNGLHETHKYGQGSVVLLNAIVNFIVHNLPPNFSLDKAVKEPAQYARLPSHTMAPPPASAQPPAAPAIARGSSVQLGKGGRRTSKITNIQFGDLSLTDGKKGPAPHPGMAEVQPVSHAVLSRILLNLPFAQLKMILESNGFGDVQGWANTESRYKVVKDAVEEREARRHRALGAVVAGRIPNSAAILSILRSPEPRYIDGWAALGWHEEILPYGSADGPSLGRRWEPVRDSTQNGSTTEYP